MSPIVNVIDNDGKLVCLDAPGGASVMEVLRDAEIDPDMGICGGCCSCASCHVWLAGDSAGDTLPPASEDEEDILDSLMNRQATSRLGCQIRLGGGVEMVTVTLPVDA
jgi:2Fe-2S ferredoxin